MTVPSQAVFAFVLEHSGDFPETQTADEFAQLFNQRHVSKRCRKEATAALLDAMYEIASSWTQETGVSQEVAAGLHAFMTITVEGVFGREYREWRASHR